MKARILKQCRELFPEWRALAEADFTLADPKGFSSFTMGIQAGAAVRPQAVFYRRLADKENAILDFDTEREVFLALGAADIAAHCHHYDDDCRIEAFYPGRTLEAAELWDPANLRPIAGELHRLHRLSPSSLPSRSFWDLSHEKWGRLARNVLEERIDAFPAKEQGMCEALREIYSPDTLARVKRCLPDGPLVFCHNDTYHGNIMKLESGEIKLLDFEFSCLNHRAYDFSNLFAETVMRHKQPDWPYFRIAEPEFGDEQLGTLIDCYLDNEEFENPAERSGLHDELLRDTKGMLLLSHYKYALAAIPLSTDPIQKIRFIPYAHERFTKFLRAYEVRRGTSL